MPSLKFVLIEAIILIVLILLTSSLFSKIFKKQVKSIESKGLDTPVYKDLDILLQEKQYFLKSENELPIIPQTVRVSIFVKVIAIIKAVSMIFISFGSILYSSSYFDPYSY